MADLSDDTRTYTPDTPATVVIVEAIKTDNVNHLADQDHEDVLAVSPPVLWIAVSYNAEMCTKYLLCISGIDVNQGFDSHSYSPLRMAIKQVINSRGDELYDAGGGLYNDEMKVACMIARDSNALYSGNVQTIESLAAPGHNNLLVALVSNPNVDINTMNQVYIGGGSTSGVCTVPLLISMMRPGREEAFRALVVNPSIKLDVHWTDDDLTPLYWAALPWAVDALMGVLADDDVIREGKRCIDYCIGRMHTGSHGTDVALRDIAIIRLFVKSSDFPLRNSILTMVIQWTVEINVCWRSCNDATATGIQACRTAFNALIDVIISQLDINAAMSCKPLHSAMCSHDEILFNKILASQGLMGSALRSPDTRDFTLNPPLVHLIIMQTQHTPKGGNSMMKKLLKFAEMRDELRHRQGELDVSCAVRLAVESERVTLLRLLLDKVAVTKKIRFDDSISPYKYAKTHGLRECVKIFAVLEAKDAAHTTETGRGHVFDCC